MFAFQNLKTLTKLAILVGLSAAATIFLLILVINGQRDQMYQDRQATLSAEVDTVTSILRYHQNLANSGVMSDVEAQNTAKAIINSLRFANDEYFFIFEKDDLILIEHPFLPELIGKTVDHIKDDQGQAIFISMQRVIETTNKGVTHYVWPKPGESTPEPKITFVNSFEPWNWVVGTGVYVDDIEAEFLSKITAVLTQFLIIMLIVGILAWTIAKQISRPLTLLAETMNIIGNEKDLVTRSTINNKSETGIISSALNMLLEQFQSSCKGIIESSSQLTVESENLATNASETHHAIENQTAQIEQIATAVNEMSATVEEVAQNTEQAHSQTRTVDEHAKQGNEILTRTVTQITDLAEEVENIAKTISDLQAEAQGIGDIVGVITSIADQTNLLALNAAIEAARAGEQGRGFAVVADEVRSLASKTQESTEEIRAKIEGLQSGTQNAFNRMQSGQQQAHQSKEQMHNVIHAFEGIASAVGDLMEMITQIATAATQQSSVAEEINRNISEVNNAAMHTNEQANQIKEISDAVSQQAQELNVITLSFKV
jgi:methyl-accepting chemotaxis protein